MAWQYFMAPSAEEMEAQKKIQDSIELENKKAAELESFRNDSSNINAPETIVPDSVKLARLQASMGAFANATIGEAQTTHLENEFFKIAFDTKGGRIREVTLKNYWKVLEDKTSGEQTRIPLKLLEDVKNKFEYIIPTAAGSINTSDLIFKIVSKDERSITMRAEAGADEYFEQRYTIQPNSYVVDYHLEMKGLNGVIPAQSNSITLNWVNYLDKIELNATYERQNSSVYFKPVEESVSYCSLSSNDKDDASGDPLKWVSHVNQFFNATLVAATPFQNGVNETKLLDDESSDLKIVSSNLSIPFEHSQNQAFEMKMFIGPNKFEALKEFGHDTYLIVPFGSSILGTINRWIIRPIFSFLSGIIGSSGLVIFMLTLIVKLLLYPLTYRMLYSQSKMGALKPQLEQLKLKYKDDQQQQQMEQMKMFREFGVNPLGGCLPMLLQMPIWIALYRFFPASIEFRQAAFLWAPDLSSYDAFIRLPFEIPLGFGAHLSLFTLLWAITTLIYTYYNTKDMDMSANPAMKYMQYIMPIMFMGFFNSFASGLTCYLLFSNVLNIGQTIVTKNLIIDQEKLKAELEANRKKPKKKGGFQERLENVLKEQQRLQAEKEEAAKKKKKS